MTVRAAMEYLKQMWVESHDRSEEAARMRMALITAVVFMQKHLDAAEKPFRNPSVERNEDNRVTISVEEFDRLNRRFHKLEARAEWADSVISRHDCELAQMDVDINRMAAILEEEGLWHE